MIDKRLFVLQMPSAVHEVPTSEFLPLLVRFQQMELPRRLVRVYTSVNQQLEGRSISAIPDLSLVLSALKGPSLRRQPFILECAFSQSAASVFNRVRELVTARPEAVMAVVILIDERTPSYESPLEGSPAWDRFERDDPLEPEDFTEEAEPQPEDSAITEAFTSRVVIAGHTWCSIERVKYYVWLKNPGDGDGAIVIDHEAIEQTEWTAHGVSPSDSTLSSSV